uniref:T9SS type A sorting domain-containing protein n=1 Tax=Nonlabens dokdonensis TaxID=328515 RepID=UPI0026F04AFF
LNNPASIDSSRFELIFNDVTLSTTQTVGLTFNMYPNPVSQNEIHISGDFAQETTTAVFYNTLGQEVFKTALTSNENQVQIGSLDAGVYLVQITSGTTSLTKKLVIK